MKCIINYSYTKEDDTSPIKSKDIVSVDESLICLSGDDRPIDIIMTCLSGITYPEGFVLIRRHLDLLTEKGVSNFRSIIFPEAVRRIHANPYFSCSADHYIDIRMQKTTYGSNSYVSLDGSEEYFMGQNELRKAKECEGNTSCPVFLDRTPSQFDDAELRIDQAASGAVLTGICDAILENESGAPINDLTPERSILTGILCAMKGHTFTAFGTRNCAEWAASACQTQLEAFKANGFLLSNRSWNPQSLHPGPRLSEAQKLACPEIRRTAAQAWHEILSVEPDHLSDVIYALTDAAGIRRAQIPSCVKENLLPRSHHSEIITQGHVLRLSNLFKIDKEKS